MKISNIEFLKTIFKGCFESAHVTDFTHDPNKIPKDYQLTAWKGDYFNRYNFHQTPSNQYFTVSIFNPDENGIARRRKALFVQTHVIVLDDVKEKLSHEAALLLPPVSYILETSNGSEQWGYILTEPCTDRSMVENLLDGLVANGLAPDGKDPGMKGVTRYVRLPEGCNTKQSKMIDGKPFECRLLEWNPFYTCTMEELAKPFNVNLKTPRRETRLDGAANIPGHPLLQCGLVIKEIRSDGRFDITCPWVGEHTGFIDDGAAIFTNADGSIGFKCHHGACETRTAKHLLDYLEEQRLGFTADYKEWQFEYVLKDIITPTNIPAPPPDVKDELLNMIKQEMPGSNQSRKLVSKFLQVIDNIPEIEKHYYHQEVCDIMQWTKVDFAKIIKDLRNGWYQKQSVEFYDSIVFIKEQNRFYDYNSKIFFTPDAFQNSFAHQDNEARKTALTEGRVEKVDKIDFAPKMPRIFNKDGLVFANTWNVMRENLGYKGDCSHWLNHWTHFGWQDNQKHMLQWMAYTILYPENKINHMLLLGGMEGTGKDFILYPLLKAMSDYGSVIDGHELLSGFNDYLLSTKYLHINETELGDHIQAMEVSNKLKPLAAAPPDTLRVNQKGISPIKVQNIVNLTMTTNSQMPIKLGGPSRRFYAVWSDLNVRDEQDEMLPLWLRYWRNQWAWMKTEGVNHCIWYLRNCVDLSDFDPGAAPKMTEFLRNIREASKSPAQQTVEAFIVNRIGAFASDLVTANNASTTLRSGMIGFEDFMYCNSTWFTPSKVGRIMRDMVGCVKLRAKREADLKPWAVRNKDIYEKMSAGELYDEYQRQLKNISTVKSKLC